MKFSMPRLQEFISDNERRGVDMKRPMLWGFFFTSKDEASFAALRRPLEEAGYRYVDVHRSDDEMWWLHVSRSEPLAAAQLLDCCNRLHALGVEHGVEFDGFDVGNIDGSILFSSES